MFVFTADVSKHDTCKGKGEVLEVFSPPKVGVKKTDKTSLYTLARFTYQTTNRLSLLATGLLFYALEYCRSLAITKWSEADRE